MLREGEGAQTSIYKAFRAYTQKKQNTIFAQKTKTHISPPPPSPHETRTCGKPELFAFRTEFVLRTSARNLTIQHPTAPLSQRFDLLFVRVRAPAIFTNPNFDLGETNTFLPADIPIGLASLPEHPTIPFSAPFSRMCCLLRVCICISYPRRRTAGDLHKPPRRQPLWMRILGLPLKTPSKRVPSTDQKRTRNCWPSTKTCDSQKRALQRCCSHFQHSTNEMGRRS